MRIKREELERLRQVAEDGLEAKSEPMMRYALGYILGYLGSVLSSKKEQE